MNEARFLGWELPDRVPFSNSHVILYSGLSKVLIGPNGFGKSRLLYDLRSHEASRLFRVLPRRLSSALSESRHAPPADLIETINGEPNSFWRLTLGAHPCLEGFDYGLLDVDRRQARTSPVPIPADDAAASVERWAVPDLTVERLTEVTQAAFESWFMRFADRIDTPIERTRNPLVIRADHSESRSLLDVAISYGNALAERTETRLRLMVGFSVELQSRPDSGFDWYARTGGRWFPLQEASSAIRRWVGLAASESIREFQMIMDDKVTSMSTSWSLDGALSGDFLNEVAPRTEATPFATKTSWIMLDEPEVHLFGSEAERLGETIAREAVSGRVIVATHSLELASRLIGSCEVLAFDQPGRYRTALPAEWGADQLSLLARQGPGILAGVHVLYVEGIWDERLVNLLFKEDLRKFRIVVCPTHGVLKASSVVTSVWQRMSARPFGIMIDALDGSDVAEAWIEIQERASHDRQRIVSSLRARSNLGNQSNEDSGLLSLQANVLEGGMEDRAIFVLHGLSDIFMVVSPRAFGLSADSWSALGFAPGSRFKDFLSKRYSIHLDAGAGAEAFARLESDHSLIDSECFGSLDAAFGRFVSGISK